MQRIYTLILNWHFDRFPDFTSAIRTAGKNLVMATMEIHKLALQNLLPTPAKTHYTFNLRDFSRVIQGLTMTVPSAYQQTSSIIRLWIHEVYRVYYDRLIADDDRVWFFGAMKQTAQSVLAVDLNSFLAHLIPSGRKELQEEDLRALMFGDFVPMATLRQIQSESGAKDGSDAEPVETKPKRIFTELTDITELTDLVKTELGKFNTLSKTKMDLVLFRFAVEHIVKICRILKLPGGNALLLGVGGSGRQSLTRLAASIAGYDLVQIEISKSYGMVEWREDLKKVIRQAGCDDKQVVFLFNDTQVKDEGFVEDLNNLLNAGEVPNMFAADEKQDIVQRCSKQLEEMGQAPDGSAMAMYNFFVERVRRNLHIVLCMSPIGEAFRRRLRQFNSLINCCTIDWFQAWPNDALAAVSEYLLKDVTLDSEEMRASIATICKDFHQTSSALSAKFLSQLKRYNYITPTSYLELMLQYKSLLATKREEVTAQRRRYGNGLEKLDFASQQVAHMQKELGDLQPQLVKTSEETSAMLITISSETKEVDKTKTVIQADEEAAAKKAEASSTMKQECENDLAEALPLLNSALAALDTLKKPDIDLVKSMKNPPDSVVCILRSGHERVCMLVNDYSLFFPAHRNLSWRRFA